MYIDKLDHLVLTVRDIQSSIDFYTTVLGMVETNFAGNRKGLRFGSQKINLHSRNEKIEPRAGQPTPGSADLCFTTDIPLDQVVSHCRACGVEIIAGPVKRSGASGDIISVYLRDPDGNLIELANPVLEFAASP